MSNPTVKILNGSLLGKTDIDLDGKKFLSFTGIPYAKPPIGDLRFKSPQPAENWEGVRNAQNESPPAIQNFLQTTNGSEDCLYLNVFTQNLPKPNNPDGNLKPVMVWIHGGGFVAGANDTSFCGPNFLVTEDVVIVTINYRIGIFGFLTFDDQSLNIPGNAGMKDMILALKWVQNNIKFFNGDPNNLSIFGVSAGGAAVHYLMLSPLSKGLFHKVIAQSGCAANIWAVGRNCTKDLAKVLGLKNATEQSVYSAIIKLNTQDLFQKSLEIPDLFKPSLNRPFGPVIEKPSNDAFICEDPETIVKSKNYMQVPFMTGYAALEGIFYEMSLKMKPLDYKLDDLDSSIPFTFKRAQNREEVVEKIKKFYFQNRSLTQDNIDCRYALESDTLFVTEILKYVKLHVLTSSKPVYLYRFSADTKLNFVKKMFGFKYSGASHGDDTGYLWKLGQIPDTDYLPGTAEYDAIKKMVTLWTNFAKYGNPNPQEKNDLIEVEWKPVTSVEKLNFLDFGSDLLVGVNPDKRRMEFWEKIYKQYA